MAPSSRIDEALLTLAWSLWGELGVASPERHHEGWAVDPEALIVFTAQLANADPRLRDESLDCALQIAPYLSMTRFKNLVRRLDAAAMTPVREYAASFNAASPAAFKLPVAATKSPRRPSRSGKSFVPHLKTGGRSYLRLRAALGVGARADCMVVMMSTPEIGWYAAELAERVGLAKRAVAIALHDLEGGGLLGATPDGNRIRYQLAEPELVAKLLGPAPGICPPWEAIVTFLVRIRRLLAGSAKRPEIALMVELGEIVDAFRKSEARFGLFRTTPGFERWSDAARWLESGARGFAVGNWPWLVKNSPIRDRPHTRPRVRTTRKTR